MRKRLTFEEAANLTNFVEAPARLPNHADVNGNPVYKQFLRLTQIYEEDEVRKRQDDLRDLWARTYDQRLGSSFHAPMPVSGGSRGPGGPGGGQPQLPGPMDPPGPSSRPTSRPTQLPGALPQPPGMPPDVQTQALGGATTAEISDAEFDDARDWERELAELQARAAQNAERARAIAESAQDTEIRNEAENRVTLMNNFSSVAQELGGGAREGVAQGIMELYNIARTRSMGEWGFGAATAVLSVSPQLVSGSAIESIALGAMSGAALSIGAVAIAKALYELGGFVSLTGRAPRTQAALTLAERTLDMFRGAARGMLEGEQVSDEEKLQLQRALEELERREAWRTRAENGEQQAIRVLEAMRKRERPLEQYPDPGDPRIEEILDPPARRQRMLEGPTEGRLALENVEGGQLALEDVEMEPGTPRTRRIDISEDRRRALMAMMRVNERDPDPQRLKSYRTNTDYRMDNGLILRLHQAPSVMRLELLSPPTVNDPTGRIIGRLAKLQTPREAPPTAIQLRRDAFALAQRLQPSTIEALAAIYKTVEMEATTVPQAAASGSGAPVAPVAKARSRSRLRPLSS